MGHSFPSNQIRRMLSKPENRRMLMKYLKKMESFRESLHSDSSMPLDTVDQSQVCNDDKSVDLRDLEDRDDNLFSDNSKETVDAIESGTQSQRHPFLPANLDLRPRKRKFIDAFWFLGWFSHYNSFLAVSSQSCVSAHSISYGPPVRIACLQDLCFTTRLTPF